MHRCVDLLLVLQCDFIDQYVCFSASAMKFFYYYCTVAQLEIRNGNTSLSPFIVQNYLVVLGFLFLHMKLNIAL